MTAKKENIIAEKSFKFALSIISLFNQLTKDEFYNIIYNFHMIYKSHEGAAFSQFNKPKLDEWFTNKIWN